jgi:pyruvate/2-oxoglutarate dehydrogenase complex dihydrolipoamide acyltransferase (E2) component
MSGAHAPDGKPMTRPAIYLDHNAASPLLPEARAALVDALDLVGNPSSVHGHGRALRNLVDTARAQVAAAAGAERKQVVFTGSATEAITQAIVGGAREISDEVKDLATRARNKKLAPHEYQGGSTAVSNLGMFGIKEFAAVINPPHGTILAVGVGEERVFADKGEIKIGQFMTCTLSCDHRSVDGALGAEVLGVFRGLIENPVMMLA